MDYGMIGQIAKAKHYTEERHRIKFHSFTVTFQGNNNTHTVTYDGQHWTCDTSFFQQHGWSAHTVALERILGPMVSSVAVEEGKESAGSSSTISQVEKAKQYTDERHRVQFTRFVATFTGENSNHTVTYGNGQWNCACHFFKTHQWCSHTIALERILAQMVNPVTNEPIQ